VTWSVIITTVQSVPKGHLQPLGSHRPKEGLVESLDYVPFPRDFYYNYVLTSKPVVFRGAAKLSKGFELWTDRYLRYDMHTVYHIVIMIL
jgi:lysine-specific demethylase 8